MNQPVTLIRRPTLRLNPHDDVVIAARPIAAGTRIDDENIACIDAIPAGHKVAVRAIAQGAPVRRYNQIIGFATQPIAAGQHVHVHNLGFEMFERQYDVGVDRRAFAAPAEPATFAGIRRPDGRVATRNYIGVIATVNCSASVSRFVAQHFTPEVMAQYPNVDGVVPISHASGCGMDTQGAGIDVLRRTIAGYSRHVNFAGVVIIGLGCESNQMDALFHAQGLGETCCQPPMRCGVSPFPPAFSRWGCSVAALMGIPVSPPTRHWARPAICWLRMVARSSCPKRPRSMAPNICSRAVRSRRRWRTS